VGAPCPDFRTCEIIQVNCRQQHNALIQSDLWYGILIGTDKRRRAHGPGTGKCLSRRQFGDCRSVNIVEPAGQTTGDPDPSCARWLLGQAVEFLGKIGFVGKAPGAEQAAEKLGVLGGIGAKCSSVAEASVDSVGVMRGLKPPPPSGLNVAQIGKFSSDRAIRDRCAGI
jgi:hypothetical protein